MSLIWQWYSREGSTQVRVEKTIGHLHVYLQVGRFTKTKSCSQIVSWSGFVHCHKKKDICKQIWPTDAEFREKMVKWHNYGCRCCVMKMRSYIILMWYHLMALRPSIFLRIWHQWVIFAWRASFLLWSFTKPDQHTLRTNFGEMAQVESLVIEKSTKEFFHSCHTRDN